MRNIFQAVIVSLLLLLGACGGAGDSPSMQSDAGYSRSDVVLQWDASTDVDISGYKVYYGSSSGVYQKILDVGNATSTTLESLAPGNWCFAVTAYSSSFVESGYSNEVCGSIY